MCSLSQDVRARSGQTALLALQVCMSHQQTVNELLIDAGFEGVVNRSTQTPDLPELSRPVLSDKPTFDEQLFLLRKELADERSSLSHANAEIERLRVNLSGKDDELAAQAAAAAAQRQLDTEAHNAAESKLKGTVEELQARVASLTRECDGLSVELTSSRARCDQLSSALLSSEARVSDLTEATSKLQAMLSDATSASSEASQAQKSSLTQLGTLVQNHKALQAENKSLAETCAQLQLQCDK